MVRVGVLVLRQCRVRVLVLRHGRRVGVLVLRHGRVRVPVRVGVLVLRHGRVGVLVLRHGRVGALVLRHGRAGDYCFGIFTPDAAPVCDAVHKYAAPV